MSDNVWVSFILRVFTVIIFFMVGCKGLRNGRLLEEMFQSQQGSPEKFLDEKTVTAGLKDVLRIGTERAVDSTSQVDGFLANELIRIALPEEFDAVASALRSIGLGNQVDALEIGMNRAAEKATGEAKVVFWEAITKITLADVYDILNGSETAVTDYFRNKTSDSLRTQFHSIVTEKMGEVGVYQVYNQVVGTYNAIPIVSKPVLDLDNYITEKTLDGLFQMIAKEEKKIRLNPAARTTELLQRVFKK